MVKEIGEEVGKEEIKNTDKKRSKCFLLYLSQKHASTLFFFLALYALYFFTQIAFRLIDNPNYSETVIKMLTRKFARTLNFTIRGKLGNNTI